MRFQPVLASILASFLGIAGCGGGTSSARNSPNHARASQPSQSHSQQQGAAQQVPTGSGRSIADAVQLCHMNGGPGRTDYSYIGGYRCSDGSVPLGGDAERGARARVGNVGAGPDGHVVDLYEIPCASGPVRVHVDAYHCGSQVDTTIDMARLSRAQLAGLAQGIRSMHADPSSAQAMELRRDLLMWITDTQQLTIVMCDGLSPLLPLSDPRPYLPELMLSMAASVIEDGRDPADPMRVHLATIQGLLVYYQAVLAQEGPSARDPQLDALLAMAQQGTLPSAVARATQGCDLGRLGVHFVR